MEKLSDDVVKKILNEALQPNMPGILVYEEWWCPITVISVTDKYIRVSKPAIADRMCTGAVVQIELCWSRGCLVFNTEVLEIPESVMEGIVLAYPRDLGNVFMRKYWRLTVNLPVVVKPHAHPQRLKGNILNISAGGMLVEFPVNAVELGETVDIFFTLPGSGNLSAMDMQLMGTVTHIAIHEDKVRISIRYVGMFPDVEESINRFVINNLRKSCPSLKI